MIYNDFQGLKLSALGMGNMRLPVLDGNDNNIDVDAAKEMIAFCMNSGINYYDTAYGYHGGNSELVVGQLLKNYERSSFYLASKFPGYDLSNMPKVEEIFEEQLKANISTYAESKPLNEAEMQLILGIADEMISRTTVPCTGCHYCVSKCPEGLDIPFLLKQYNEAMVAGAGEFIAPMALSSIAEDKQPECCIECRCCEKVCPQMIKISEELKKFVAKMGR